MEFTFKGEKYKLDKKFWDKEYKTHPMPNDAEIVGSAVAIHCTKDKK